MPFSEFNTAEFHQFVQDHLEEDPAGLLFKYQGKVAFDLKMAVQQIAARQKAAKKLPTWSKNLNLLKAHKSRQDAMFCCCGDITL